MSHVRREVSWLYITRAPAGLLWVTARAGDRSTPMHLELSDSAASSQRAEVAKPGIGGMRAVLTKRTVLCTRQLIDREFARGYLSMADTTHLRLREHAYSASVVLCFRLSVSAELARLANAEPPLPRCDPPESPGMHADHPTARGKRCAWSVVVIAKKLKPGDGTSDPNGA